MLFKSNIKAKGNTITKILHHHPYQRRQKIVLFKICIFTELLHCYWLLLWWCWWIINVEPPIFFVFSLAHLWLVDQMKKRKIKYHHTTNEKWKNIKYKILPHYPNPSIGTYSDGADDVIVPIITCEISNISKDEKIGNLLESMLVMFGWCEWRLSARSNCGDGTCQSCNATNL